MTCIWCVLSSFCCQVRENSFISFSFSPSLSWDRVRLRERYCYHSIKRKRIGKLEKEIMTFYAYHPRPAPVPFPKIIFFLQVYSDHFLFFLFFLLPGPLPFNKKNHLIFPRSIPKLKFLGKQIYTLLEIFFIFYCVCICIQIRINKENFYRGFLIFSNPFL